MRYQTKPVEIEAVQYTGDNLDEVLSFCGHAHYDGEFYIPTLEGVMRAAPGDYIIKGLRGEFYPCKPDVFEMKYEPVDDSDSGRLKRHFIAWARQLRESVKIGRQLTTDN